MKKIGAKNPFGVTDGRVGPATEAEVAKLEGRLGAKLPEDYRDFLMTINGGRRPGGGWKLPGHDLEVDAFYGLRGDSHDLADAVDRVLRGEAGTTHFPADAIPIGREFGGTRILMKYRGKAAGSIWSSDETEADWRKVATRFGAFIAKLHQEPESQERAAVRGILERDDVDAARRYVESLSPGKLDESDESTGHSLLQRAADAGAAKVVAFLIDRGASGLVGLGGCNRHARVVELLLARGRYLPTEYDWLGAATFGGPAVLRLYFDLAPTPPLKILKTMLQGSKNLMQSRPSEEREQVTGMLEERLASSAVAPDSVRKLNGS